MKHTLGLLAIIAGLLVSANAAQKPNIVVVFIDDMGWSDISCFGGDVVKTEHIDRLADEGIRFTNFYVNSPICSPSRVALTTGQYPQRWKISSYLNNRKDNIKRGMAQWLDPHAPVLARELQKAGYRTGHFGKWHMGGQRDVGDAPLISEYGFDRSLTNFEGLGPRVLPLKDAYNGKPPQKHDLGSASLGHGPIRWMDRSRITSEFVKGALDFIDDAQKANQPFYVNLWPDDVHSPFFPSQALRSKTDGSKRELYYAVLDAMDKQLGVLFDRIRNDKKLRDNTLIVFASDNGHEDGAGKSDPLRGSKTWLYEGGVRSPLIVWGPGLLAKKTAGTTNGELIFCALDVNASLYEIAGIKPSGKLDGEVLADTLLGNRKQSRAAPIFWRRPPDCPGSKDEDNPDLAMRDGKWKFHINQDGSDAQLYDLDADIAESRNLARQYPGEVARLKKALFAWNATMPRDAGDPAFSTDRKTGQGGALPASQFVNPICEGADPWVVFDQKSSRYLWCFSDGNRAIAIHAGKDLTSLGKKHIVWRAPKKGPLSRQVWAPELHFLDGRWHIYFAASDGDNANHLAYALRSTSDAPLGDYELHGPFPTGEGARNLWAIDMTVLEHAGKCYAIWSGWDDVGTDRQYLYIAPMKSPVELAGPRVRICANDDYPWELTEPGERGRGLHEGPQVLQAKGRTFLLYSCAASWLPSYKLGMLELTGNDPLDPRSWKKNPTPVFSSSDETFGVGHSCFVPAPDGTGLWHVYHAKRDRKPGWRRAVFAQPMHIDAIGVPQFGEPVAPGSLLDKPSAGAAPPKAELPVALPLKDEGALVGWDYYGHHQYVAPSAAGIHLGRVPEEAINEYRSGEKLILNQLLPPDVSVEVEIDFLGDGRARDAGILFRISGASVGFDAQRGYFAGLIPKTGLVVLGKTDGTSWTELARAPAQIDASRPQSLRVAVAGSLIAVDLNGVRAITTTDTTYGTGSVGLRVVETHAVFSDLLIKKYSPPVVDSAGAEGKPNIVFILADDCTHSSLGCYGGKNVPTPNIDRLAAEGMRFTQTHASTSMCVPFRHELYTGLYPMRNGSVWNHSATRPGTKSVVHHLLGLGYRVGITGKRHVYPHANFPFETVPGFEGNCVAQKDRYEPQEILPFMARNRRQPFCLFICSPNPHPPWTMGDASVFDRAKLKLPPSLPDTPVIREEYAHYLAEVGELDRQVGDVMRMLEEQGLAENTLLMFSSEQGWQFLGGKWNAWDLSLHTALLARWPGHIQPGKSSDAMVQVCDVLPTLIEAAGGTPDAGRFDGKSFMPILAGKETRHRDMVFGMHNNVPEGPSYPIRTVRNADFRYIANLEPDRTYVGKYINGASKSAWFKSMKDAADQGDRQAEQLTERYLHRPAEELYSTDDPYELNNLAQNPEYAREKATLRTALQNWMDTQGDTGADLDRQQKLDENRAAFGWKK